MARIKALGRVKLVRTQVSLTPEEHRRVRQLAESLGTSMSQVVREALSDFKVKEDGVPLEKMLEIVGIGQSGNPRASVDHDKVIYG